MDEPSRTYAGETGREYRCDRCREWSKLERDADSRSVEKIGDGNLVDVDTPADLDPPLLPTTYRCARCGHVHAQLPAD